MISGTKMAYAEPDIHLANRLCDIQSVKLIVRYGFGEERRTVFTTAPPLSAGVAFHSKFLRPQSNLVVGYFINLNCWMAETSGRELSLCLHEQQQQQQKSREEENICQKP